ncbi:baculoviral IAP repeat-containing protein 7-like isoform X2 [Mya arenaria]|uniref:baculoviral IAP repeat-containing protein 7-like isoform X2 n=1 Tax=Mya arenaria TaxID=6604 RepID=UPI0022E1F1BE|nr:baculoviral IAP repeat-containing protein 7-like isoform X2 [Mya arenaria]
MASFSRAMRTLFGATSAVSNSKTSARLAIHYQSILNTLAAVTSSLTYMGLLDWNRKGPGIIQLLIRTEILQCLINDPETLRKRQLESFHTQTAPDRTNRRPEFACYEARLDTFDGWSEDVSQKPHQLADAGLYFTGVEDHVRCFACDGGLWQWDAGDDPWVEHCRWFPACHFARTSKGDQYIERIQASIDQGEDLSELEETRPSGKDDTTLGLTKLEQHRRTLTAEEIKEDAIQHRKYGNISPTLNDLNIRKRNEIRPIQQEAAAAVDRHESIFEENSRLKHILKCQWCNVNNVNALFLPCAHHRMCMECASKHDITVCFVCDRHIREIIKTFMG